VYLNNKPSSTSWKIFTIAITVAMVVFALAAGLFFRSRLPEEKAEAINPTLPTPSIPAESDNASVSKALTQTVNGIEVSATNFHRIGNQVQIDACYSLLDNGNWLMHYASLKYLEGTKEVEVSNFSTVPIVLRQLPIAAQQQIITFDSSSARIAAVAAAVQGKIAYRCDTIQFDVSSNANLSNATFTVQKIGAYPDEGEVCSAYLTKAQRILDERGLGIKVGCEKQPGMENLTVLSKPASMSQEEAQSIVYSPDLTDVSGPWVFIANIQ
jgi:hypothetical protein